MKSLNAEEREILEAFEKGELKPISNKDAELKHHQEYATVTFKKGKRVNIRIKSGEKHVLIKSR